MKINMYNIIYISLIVFVLCTIQVSALFGSLDDVTTELNIDRGEPAMIGDQTIDYKSIWEKYPPVEIKDLFGLGSTIMSGAITDHTELCSNNCYSDIVIDIKEDSALIEDIRFYTINLDDSKTQEPIRKITLKRAISNTPRQVEDYEIQCDSTLDKNGSIIESCDNVLVGDHTEYDYTYVDYNIGDVVPAGTYNVRLEGEKRADRSVDWQIKTQGKWITDWSVWGGSGNIISLTQLINFTSNNTLETSNGSQMRIWAVNGTNYTLNAITKLPSDTATRCYVAVNATTILINSTVFNGNDCIINYNLLGNNTYYLGLDSNGIAYNRQRGVATNLPQNSSFIHWDCNYDTYPADVSCYTNARSIWGANITVVSSFLISTITLNSPADNFLTSNPNVTFNATINVVGANVVNASLWINTTGTFKLNQTRALTGTNNNTIFGLNLSVPDGYYLWNIQGCDSDNVCGFSNDNRTIKIATNPPRLNITYPTPTIPYAYLGQNISLNYSIINSSFSTQNCIFNYNAGNFSVPCGTNGSIVLTSQSNFTFFVNDTLGNYNTGIWNWTYYLFIVNQTYSSTTTVGSAEQFGINLTYDPVHYPSVNAILTYNGTNYTGSPDGLGTNLNFISNITIPVISGTQQNITFFWNVILINSTGSTTIQSNSNTQGVGTISIDNCAVNTVRIYNFTMFDEDAETFLNGTIFNSTIEVTLNLYSLSGDQIANFSSNFTKINPIAICIKTGILNVSSYLSDITLRYDADSYASEFYNEQKTLLSLATIPRNIPLYDLLTTRAQEFKIIFKDASLLALSNYLVQVNRKYLSDGSYKTVEIGKTDDTGQTLVHLVLSDVIYKLTLTKDGNLIYTYPEFQAVCDNIAIGDCEITKFLYTTAPTLDDFTTTNGIQFTPLLYNSSTRMLSSSFTVVDGTSQTVGLNVTDLQGRQVATTSLTSSSGSLLLTIPAVPVGNGVSNNTLIAKLFKGASGGLASQTLASGILDLSQKPSDLFGNSRVLMIVGIILTMVMMSLSSGGLMLVMFILGIVFSSGLSLMSFLGLGDSGVIFGGFAGGLLGAVVLTIIYFVKKRGEDRTEG